MSLKKNEPIVIEFYGIQLFGRVIQVTGSEVIYRNEVGQRFKTEIESVRKLSAEQAEEFGI
jgi:hypothetical protein